MDFDLVEDKLGEIYSSAGVAQGLVRIIQSKTVGEGVKLTPSQLEGLRREAASRIQEIKDALRVVEQEIGR